MATTTSKIAAVEDALVAALKLRPGLAGVQVDIGPLGDENAREHIQIGVGVGASVSVQQEWGALGNRQRDESGVIHGEIYVKKPGAGASAIRAARDRAWELLAEVEEQLRDDYRIGGLVYLSGMQASEETRGMDPGNRISILHFSIEYRARLPRS